VAVRAAAAAIKLWPSTAQNTGVARLAAVRKGRAQTELVL